MIRQIVPLVLFLALHTAAVAQRRDTIFLKEVVVHDTRLFDKEVAGGKETRVDTVIMAENLNHTLSELLSENTHVFIKSYGRGSLATASFRGTAPSHTQVMWNGMSINSPMLGMVDFSLLPVYFIDDLSLKHGGASVEAGSGALGGNITLQNKPDWGNTFSGRFVQGIGSFGTTEDFLQLNVGNGKFQSKTRAYHTHSQNDFPFYNDEIVGKPRVRNANGMYTMYSVMQEFYGQLNERNILSLRGWVHLADRSIPKLNSSEVPDNSNVNSQLDRTWRVNAEWRHHYSKGTVVATAGLNLQDLDYSLTSQINGQAPYTAINSVSRSSSYINRIELKHDFSPTSTFSFNANYNYHDAQTQEDVKKTGYLKDRHEINAYAAYQRSFSDRANLKLSLRQDYIDHELIPLIPYAGFDYRVWARKDFFVKANVVRNYHVPTLNDLYWQPGGNPLLKPEYGLTEEAGVAWLTKRRSVVLETQVTGYYSDIADWILWVPTVRGYWVPLNVKRVVSKGIEVSINIKYVRGPWKFTLNTNYALTRSLNYGDRKTWGDESYGKQLVYIPIHSGNLFINARYKSTSITWQHNSYSKRFTTSSNDVKHTGSLTDYFMNQLYVAQEFKFKKFGFEAQLKVYNLFDEYYRSVLARRMPERNYMLLLMFKF